MGNSTSQCFGYSKEVMKKSSAKTAMLLDTSGNIRKIKVPVKSAEIMIEEPGHVITPVDELRRTRRISALLADQELVGGKAYLLVPASRVHSKASEFEMAIAEKRRKKGVNGDMAKVVPVQVVSIKEAQNELKVLPLLQCQRLGNQRRWNPVLDSILESPRDLRN